MTDVYYDDAEKTQEDDTEEDKNADEESVILKVRFLISNYAAGTIIGKGGANIAEFQEQSGARIQMSRTGEYFPGTGDRVAILTGSVNSILTALHLILTKMESEPRRTTDGNPEAPSFPVKIAVPGPCTGGIIGKGGSTIKTFVEDSGAVIKVSPQEQTIPGLNERIVTIQGTIEQQLRAVALVVTRVSDDPNYGVFSSVPIPYSSVPAASVSGGRSSHRGPNIESSVIQPATAATTTVTVAVPDEHVGAVVGKGGKIIHEIQDMSGARVKISARDDLVPNTNHRKVTITGTSDAVQIAQLLVAKKVQDSAANADR